MAAVLPLILLVMALYFVILPQRRRAQAQRSMISALAPGDRVVTAGGLIGTLRGIDGERAFVEVADGVVLELLAPAVVRRLDAEHDPDQPADEPTVEPTTHDDHPEEN